MGHDWIHMTHKITLFGRQPCLFLKDLQNISKACLVTLHTVYLPSWNTFPKFKSIWYKRFGLRPCCSSPPTRCNPKWLLRKDTRPSQPPKKTVSTGLRDSYHLPQSPVGDYCPCETTAWRHVRQGAVSPQQDQPCSSNCFMCMARLRCHSILRREENIQSWESTLHWERAPREHRWVTF